MILRKNNIEFNVDASAYITLKDLKLVVGSSRHKSLLQVRTPTGLLSAAKFLLNTNRRVIYLDGNTQNLLFNNLMVKIPKIFVEKESKEIRRKRTYLKYQTSECGKELAKIWKRTPKAKYGMLKRSGKAVIITLDEYTEFIMKNPNCYYCFDNVFKFTGGSLDRINNSIGYEVNNVLTCCGDCNKLRGDRLTVNETKHVISELLKYRKENSNV